MLLHMCRLAGWDLSVAAYARSRPTPRARRTGACVQTLPQRRCFTHVLAPVGAERPCPGAPDTGVSPPVSNRRRSLLCGPEQGARRPRAEMPSTPGIRRPDDRTTDDRTTDDRTTGRPDADAGDVPGGGQREQRPIRWADLVRPKADTREHSVRSGRLGSAAEIHGFHQRPRGSRGSSAESWIGLGVTDQKWSRPSHRPHTAARSDAGSRGRCRDRRTSSRGSGP